MINTISGVIALTIMLGACIVLTIYQVKVEKKRKEYIKKLNDHDKAVLLEYLKINGFEKEQKK